MLRKLFSTIAILSMLLAVSGGTVSAVSPQATTAGTTFVISRDGATSTYHADSPGINFIGSLKFVVERAVEELKTGGGGVISFQAGDFDLGSDWFEIKDATDIIFEGQGIDVTILRNNTSASTDTEPFDMTRSDRITIRDLTISAGGPGRTTSDAIDFDGGDDNIVERVKVDGARGRGIIFDGKDAVSVNGGTADRNIVRDCIVINVPQDGIQLLASNDNVIENCQISDVGGDGIRVNKASTSADQANKPSNDNIIRNNLIVNVGDNGIRVNSGNRNVITGNTVLNSGDDASSRDGIHINSSNSQLCDDNVVQLNTATDNQAVKTQEYGLRINDPECHRTVVSDNNFVGNLIGEIRDDGTGTIYTSADSEPPTAPTGLMAVSITAGQVDLAWTASSDNVAVNSYEIYRDGALIGAVAGDTTQYQDTTVAAGTSYQYIAYARDTAGNVSGPSNALDVTTLPPPPTLTFTPTDDAYISESRSTSNYNRTTIDVDGSSKKDGLLRFDVSGVGSQSIASATLRLFVTNSSSTGGDFLKTTDTNWSEDTVTWATAPLGDGGLLGSLASVISGSWYEVDVTPLVSGDGPVSVRITSTDPNGVDYASKENVNGNSPELVVVLDVITEPDTEAPSAPTNLTATDVQFDSVSLSWDASSDNVGVTGYDIYRDGGLIGSVAGDTTTFQDVTVAAETGYQYIANARDAAGNVSGPSNALDVTTPAAPPPDTEAPTAPTNLAATDVQFNSVAMSWDPSSDNIGVTGYDIYRDGGLIGSVAGDTTTFQDATVAAETGYQYIAYARDAAGNVSGSSNTLDVTTPAAPDTEAPTAPTNLAATDVQPNSVTLSWDPSSDNVAVTGYDIYRDGGLVGSVAGDTTTFQDATVAADTGYQYNAYARDAAGNVSGPSNTLDVSTPAVPDTEAPSAPTNLAATDVQASSVTLSWDASSDNVAVTAYDVYRDGGLIGSVPGNTTTFQDATVAAEISYQYIAYARDAAGNVSDPSNTLDVTTPAAPSVLTFTPSDDAYIKESSPGSNYNTSTINVDASSRKDGLLRFDVSGIGVQSIASVTLRLYVTDSSPIGGEFYKMTDTNWSEGTVTWATAPLGDGGLFATLGTVIAGNWYEIDLTPLVTGNGVVSLRITSTDSNGVDYASKENANGFAPELIVVLQ